MHGPSQGPMAYGGMGGASGVPTPPNMDVNMGRNVPVTPEMDMGMGSGMMTPNGLGGGMMDMTKQMVQGVRGMMFDTGAKNRMGVMEESDSESMYDSDDDYEQL